MISLTFCSLVAEENKNNFSGYPFAAYSNETSVMLGAFGVYTDRDNRPDSLNANQYIANVIYSFKNQLSFILIPDIYFKEDLYRLSIPIRIKNWPNSFYGYGDTDYEEEKYTEFNTEIDFEFERRILRNVNLGFVANYWYDNIYKTKDSGILQDLDFPGREKYQVFGFGPLITFDSRDNKNFPFNGFLYKFKMNFYTKELGDYKFTKSEHDLRFFFLFQINKYRAFS